MCEQKTIQRCSDEERRSNNRRQRSATKKKVTLDRSIQTPETMGNMCVFSCYCLFVIVAVVVIALLIASRTGLASLARALRSFQHELLLLSLLLLLLLLVLLLWLIVTVLCWFFAFFFLLLLLLWGQGPFWAHFYIKMNPPARCCQWVDPYYK